MARLAPPPVLPRGAADLRYPWPSVRPQRDRYLEEQARAWALGHQLLSEDGIGRFDAVNVGLLTALTYPSAPLERQVLLAQFFGWIFLQDDTFDEPSAAPAAQRLARHLSGCAKVLRSGLLPRGACPRLVALKDLRDRIVGSCELVWFERFCRSMDAYLQEGVMEERRLREGGAVPGASAYLRARVYSVCLLPPLDLAEWAHGVAVPEVVASSPALQRLQALAALIAGLANDVFSFRKEQRQGDLNNLVLLRMAEGLAEPAALAHVVDMHDALVARFERDSQTLEEEGVPAHPLLELQVESCRRWMVGAVDWQRRSERYREAHGAPRGSLPSARSLLDDQAGALGPAPPAQRAS